ncbi:hypothetical protein SB861_49950 [Paraburkholderia sp. SIMBA_049]
MNGLAVFELFVRSLPPQRNFLVAAGLEQAIDYLTGLRVRDEAMKWMRSRSSRSPVRRPATRCSSTHMTPGPLPARSSNSRTG